MTRGLILALCVLPVLGFAQGRGEFQLTKINRNLVTTPQYSYNGGPQYRTDQAAKWLEVEAEFTALPEITDDLTVKYFIMINGKLLTGEVTHTNILAGRERRSVMYVTPMALARFNGNKPMTQQTIQNIAVQLVQQGAVKDELSVVRAPAGWFSTLPALPGFVLNKNDTPFAPLFWDRYEQIRPPAPR
jgi:hypothetical protein